MQVDWITTIAQIINFLVLVYLLKRFLYRPIVNAIDRREEGIAQRLAEANQQAALAQQHIDDYQHKMQELEQQREQLLEAAKREAEVQRSHLLGELRDEMDTIRARWQGEVEREQQAFLAQARQVIGDQVCLVARQAFSELADAELEQQILVVFLHKLAEISAEDKARLAQSAAQKGLVVETGYELSPAQREKISALIHEHIAPELAVRYEQVPTLICGINLKGPGFKLQWNLDSFLEDIDERLSSQLAITTASE
jgi:F-type H+-transporting ATPase subunit b